MLRVGILKASEAPSAQFPYGHMRDKFIFRCALAHCKRHADVHHVVSTLTCGIDDFGLVL